MFHRKQNGDLFKKKIKKNLKESKIIDYSLFKRDLEAQTALVEIH